MEQGTCEGIIASNSSTYIVSCALTFKLIYDWMLLQGQNNIFMKRWEFIPRAENQT